MCGSYLIRPQRMLMMLKEIKVRREEGAFIQRLKSVRSQDKKVGREREEQLRYASGETKQKSHSRDELCRRFLCEL